MPNRQPAGIPLITFDDSPPIWAARASGRYDRKKTEASHPMRSLWGSCSAWTSCSPGAKSGSSPLTLSVCLHSALVRWLEVWFKAAPRQILSANTPIERLARAPRPWGSIAYRGELCDPQGTMLCQSWPADLPVFTECQCRDGRVSNDCDRSW